MDKKMRDLIIDSYTLKDCIFLLAFGAPDLLAQIAEEIKLLPDRPDTIEKARNAVREAVKREMQTN